MKRMRKTWQLRGEKFASSPKPSTVSSSSSKPRHQSPQPNRPRHQATETVAASWRRLVAVFAVAATLAGGLTAAAMPQGAQAAGTPDNPKATLTVTKTADGTGHGTSEQTFITVENGFPIGDESPTDGVVASGDIVTYALHLDATAGVERDVKVALDLPDYLEIRDNTWCTSFGPVKAELSDNDNVCSFHIPRGSVFNVDRALILLAKDTGGEVIEGQVLGADLSKDDSDVYAHVDAMPVTVVSAPAADVYWYNDLKVYKNQNASGTLTLKVRQLQYAQGSSTKGASTSGPWTGTLDVSAFPAGTTWTVDGEAVTVTNGTIPVSGTGGSNVSVAFTMPAGWPVMDDGTPYLDFDIGLNVNEDAFAADDRMLNMGIGYDPGTNQGRDESTANAQTGASAGIVYANNNWTRVRVVNQIAPIASIGKNLYRPYGDESMFDASSKSFEASGTRSVLVDNEVDRAFQYVDAGTQLTSNVWSQTTNITLPQGVTTDDISLVLGDTFNAKDIQGTSFRQYQRYDPSRAIVVTSPDGNALSPLDYNVQYSESDTVTTADVAVQNSNLLWRAGTPTADALAVRVIIKAGAWKTGTTDGGLYTLSIPTRIITVDDSGNEIKAMDDNGNPVEGVDPLISHFTNPADNLNSVPDRGVSALWNTEDGSDPALYCTDAAEITGTGACYVQRYVTTIAQKRIGATVDIMSKNANGKYVDDSTNAFNADGTVDYLVTSGVTNAWSATSDSTPTVTVTLDKCQNVPVNTSADWDMEVTPGSPGANGRICGSDDSTPITLTFRLLPGTKTSVSRPDKNTGQVTTNWPAITYSAHINPTSPGGEQSAEAAVSVVRSEGENVETSTADDTTLITIEPLGVGYGVINADEHNVEAGDDLNYTATMIGANSSERIIVLPRNDDESLGEDVDWENYDGEKRTNYPEDSELTLKSVTVDSENSTKSTLFYTTCENPGIDPDGDEYSEEGDCDWRDLTDATDLSKVTALKVVALPEDVDPAEGSVAIATVNITLGTADNEEPNTYLMWLSREASNPDRTQPWPADTQVVSSQFGGNVWWDNDRDGKIDDGETGIEGITVELYKADDVDADGKPKSGAIALATTTTDENGHYQFTKLNSGKYVTVMTRDGTLLPKTIHTHYNQKLCVDQTYSYQGKYGRVGDPGKDCETELPNGVDHAYGTYATTTSGTINLAKDGRNNDAPTPDNVDFGWVKPDPRVEVDKSTAIVSDNLNEDGTKDGTSTVKWNVTITNTGNQAITGGTLTDRTSDDVYDVQAVHKDATLQSNIVGPPLPSDCAFVLTDSTGVMWRVDGGSQHNVTKVAAADGQSLDGVSFAANLVGPKISGDNSYGSYIQSDTSGTLWRVSGDGTVRKVTAADGQSLDGVTFAPDLVGSDLNGRDTSFFMLSDTSGKLWQVTGAGVASSVAGMDGVTFTSGQIGPDLYTESDKDYRFVMSDSSGVLRLMKWDGSGSMVTSSDASFASTSFATDLVGARLENTSVSFVVTDGEGVPWWITGAGVASRVTSSNASFGSATFGANLVSPNISDTSNAILMTDNKGVLWRVARDGKAKKVTPASGQLFVGVSFPSGLISTDSRYTTVLSDTSGALWRVTTDGKASRVTGADGTSFASGLVSSPFNDNTYFTDESGVLWKVTKAGVASHVTGAESARFASGLVGPYYYFYPNVTDSFVLSDSTGSLWYVSGDTATKIDASQFEQDWRPLALVSSKSVDNAGGDTFVQRKYSLPYIAPGATVTVTLTGQVRQPGEYCGEDGTANALVVANQAFFDSPSTPISGLIPVNGDGEYDAEGTRHPEGDATPKLPVVPTVEKAKAEPTGIGGVNYVDENGKYDPDSYPDGPTDGTDDNPTCSADMSWGNQPRGEQEDSCDQVPAVIETSGKPVGSLSGVVWFDKNKDGVRGKDDDGRDEPWVPGVKVSLYWGEKLIGDTVTNEQGEYQFKNVRAGNSDKESAKDRVDTAVAAGNVAVNAAKTDAEVEKAKSDAQLAIRKIVADVSLEDYAEEVNKKIDARSDVSEDDKEDAKVSVADALDDARTAVDGAEDLAGVDTKVTNGKQTMDDIYDGLDPAEQAGSQTAETIDTTANLDNTIDDPGAFGDEAKSDIDDLPNLTDNHQVVMDYSGVTQDSNGDPLPSGAGHSLAWTGKDAGDDDTLDSEVDAYGQTAAMLSIESCEETKHIDGGLIDVRSGIYVVKEGGGKTGKTPEGQEDPTPVEVGLENAAYKDTTVTVTATNTGEEALTDLVFMDEKLVGEDGVTGWTWTLKSESGEVLRTGDGMALDEDLIFEPGDVLIFTGTLKGSAISPTKSHADDATVGGIGQITSTWKEDDDTWAAKAQDPTPKLVVAKGSGDSSNVTDATRDGNRGDLQAPTVSQETDTDGLGGWPEQPVYVSFTNKGDEPLANINVADSTEVGESVKLDSWRFTFKDKDGHIKKNDAGDELKDLTAAQLNALTLAPGETVVGKGTLQFTKPDEHRGTFTASGVGTISGRAVSDKDSFTATALTMFEFAKTDDTGTSSALGKPLKGAEFRLFVAKEGAYPGALINDVDKTDNRNDVWKWVADATSADDTGIVRFKQLESGKTYRLVETETSGATDSSPLGYLLPSGQWNVTVTLDDSNENGYKTTITSVTASGSEPPAFVCQTTRRSGDTRAFIVVDGCSEGSTNSTTGELRVLDLPNTPRMTLPASGQATLWLLIALSLILATIGGTRVLVSERTEPTRGRHLR